MTLSFLAFAYYHNVLNILRENAINLSSKPNDKLKEKTQTMPELALWFWIHKTTLLDLFAETPRGGFSKQNLFSN